MTNQPVKMPKIGQVMEQGTVLEWHHSSGDQVTEGSLLVTIETDKAAMELNAPHSGRLHILVEAGTEVAVDTVIAEIGDERPGELRAVPARPVPQPGAAAEPHAERRHLLSPKARRLAAEHGIDPSQIKASSADGIVSVKDIEDYLAGLPTQVEARPASPAQPQPREPLSGLRLSAARRLTRVWQKVPHIVQMVDVDASQLKREHQRLKDAGQPATLNDLILHATAATLAEHPDLNAVVEDECIVRYSDVNIGFAVDTPRGLLVPVLHQANRLTLPELAAATARLGEQARANRLSPDGLSDASLAVSNLGMYGIRMGTPVLGPGQSILVFVGAIEERPVVQNGQLAVGTQLTLSIAYDHRLTDGVAAARFTAGLKARIERYRA